MKKNLLLIAAIFCMLTSSFATTYMVNVGGMSFTPSSLTVHPGDVVMFMWTDGTHTTTSTTIPAGATSWNSNINSSTTSFSYTPTVLGTYHYQCNFHVSMGMVGTITVVSATGVAPVSTTPIFSMFPNPVSGSLHLMLNNPGVPISITLTNMNGTKVMSKVYSGAKETIINMKGMPNGTYFINAVQGDKAYKQELIVLQ